MELMGTMGLTGFDILWQGESGAWRAPKAASRKKCNSRDQKEGGWYILNRAREPKMEIPDRRKFHPFDQPLLIDQNLLQSPQHQVVKSTPLAGGLIGQLKEKLSRDVYGCTDALLSGNRHNSIFALCERQRLRGLGSALGCARNSVRIAP